MTNNNLAIRLLLCGGLLFSCAAFAQTRYVSDDLEITMRTGPAKDKKIVRILKSGTAVNVLDVDDGKGYSRVREPGGEEGWVLTRYLMGEPSAREQLTTVRQRMKELERENEKLEIELAQIDILQNTVDRLKQENNLQTEELKTIRQTAASTLSIDEENQTLKEAMSTLVREKDSLQAENQNLRNNSQQQWFVRGAGVVLLGIIIGLVIPKIRWRRRRGWGEF
ncbi:MAG: TIGR04211 family SH3 domain-containing protein [Gammaproteobacteria bacterium]|nr:TIGR04211 family SH3 domain-containing protein [Gammaproteobacteria bacterium]